MFNKSHPLSILFQKLLRFDFWWYPGIIKNITEKSCWVFMAPLISACAIHCLTRWMAASENSRASALTWKNSIIGFKRLWNSGGKAPHGTMWALLCCAGLFSRLQYDLLSHFSCHILILLFIITEKHNAEVSVLFCFPSSVFGSFVFRMLTQFKKHSYRNAGAAAAGWGCTR